MYKNNRSIILASGSPRRQQFLQELGLEFEVCVASIDEAPEEDEKAEHFVLRMAEEKAAHVADQFPEHVIISGDTIVCLSQTILGKPKSEAHAVELLMMLSGKRHLVRSAFCVMNKAQGMCKTIGVATAVSFTPFTEEVARAYVATGEPMDKAGAYGIQGIGGNLVQSIDGSYSNVVGLPMAELVSVLMEEKVICIANP